MLLCPLPEVYFPADSMVPIVFDLQKVYQEVHIE